MAMQARERFAALVEEFRAIQTSAASLVDGLTDEQARWRPSPEQWSIAECLIHLNTATKGYLERLERANREARESDNPSLHSTLFGRAFIWWMEPPVRMRAPAPKGFLPPPPTERIEDIMGAFTAMNDRLSSAAADAARRDFTGVTISSPVTRKLRFTVSDTFRFIAAHERRHLWQASKIRQALTG